MEGQETTNITVTIAGRPYPLRITAKDETAIRKLVKEVNDKVNRFQLTYTNRDKQDCLAMAILAYAVDLHKSKQSPLAATSTARIDAKLMHLNDFLDELLKGD